MNTRLDTETENYVSKEETRPAVDTPSTESQRSDPFPRRLLFLSHATPQENAFAKWLATQLAIAGYEVWCDVTDLLGGERFWADIAEAIDGSAFRFLFASTKESNEKQGTLRELALALEAQKKHAIKDFVVPLKVDQFPFGSTQESIRDLNFVRFDENWAAGFAQLLALLEREGAPKSATSGPDCVTEWHRRSLDYRRQIVVSDNKCFSNWFRLRLPKQLWLHRFRGPPDKLPAVAAGFKRPYRIHGAHLVTFATADEVHEWFGPAAIFADVCEKETAVFIKEGDDDLAISPLDANNIVNDLARQAWDAAMTARGLCSHVLASGLAAWFFREGYLQKNKAFFLSQGKRRTFRQLVGRKSKRTLDGTRVRDGFWHYALSASVQLSHFPRILLHHHVVFTDDGQTPWSNPARMHKARRSVCKNWWNTEWRDRLFAFCAVLAQGGEDFLLPVSDEESIRVPMVPIIFNSPWTYFEDGETGLDENAEIELVEEPEHDDDDEDDENA
jgi:hypothetical protein